MILQFKKREYLLVFIISLVISFAIFGNGLRGEFVFDDTAVIQNRGDIKDLGNFLSLFISPYHQNMPRTGLYRPFTIATYSLNYLAFGESPLSFHFVNVFIHALNSVLVFWLIYHFLKSKRLAYIAFLLFLAHPIHTEAVTWIVGRAELLAFFWSLLAIYFFSKKSYIGASISFFLGLWSKEIALMSVPIIFYLVWAFEGRNLRESLRSIYFFSMPLGIYSIFRYVALGQHFLGGSTTTLVENPIATASFFERIATSFKVLSLYIQKLIWPVNLSADYSYNTIEVISNILRSPASIAGILIFAALFCIALHPQSRKIGLGVGAAVFLAPYLMISNIFITVGTIMGERLIYFSSLGFILIVAFLIDKIFNYSKYLGYFILTGLLIFYGARTVVRNSDWLNSRVLFEATLRESPNSLIARTAMGAVHIRNNEWDMAKEQLEIARNIYEDNSHLQNLLGIIADHDGNFELAEERYKKSVALNDAAINTYINLAEMYIKQERYEEAGENFLKIIEFIPVMEYVIRYSYIQITVNKPDQAIEAINKYYGDNINHPDLSAVLGTAYFVKGDYKNAVIYLTTAKSLGNMSTEIEEMLKIAREKINI